MAAFMPTYDPATGTIRPIPMCVVSITLPSYFIADNFRFSTTCTPPPQNTPFVALAPTLTSSSRPLHLPDVLGLPGHQSAPLHDTVEVQTSDLRAMMDGLQQLQQQSHVLRQSRSRSSIAQYDVSGEVSLFSNLNIMQTILSN